MIINYVVKLHALAFQKRKQLPRGEDAVNIKRLKMIRRYLWKKGISSQYLKMISAVGQLIEAFFNWLIEKRKYKVLIRLGL